MTKKHLKTTTESGTLAPATPGHSEVATEQLEKLIGGLSFTFKLVAVKTVSWAYD